MAEEWTLILGISHVFQKIITLKKKKKRDRPKRGRHGKPQNICFLWMEKMREMEKGERVTWEPTPPSGLWGRKGKFGGLELC